MARMNFEKKDQVKGKSKRKTKCVHTHVEEVIRYPARNSKGKIKTVDLLLLDCEKQSRRHQEVERVAKGKRQ